MDREAQISDDPRAQEPPKLRIQGPGIGRDGEGCISLVCNLPAELPDHGHLFQHILDILYPLCWRVVRLHYIYLLDLWLCYFGARIHSVMCVAPMGFRQANMLMSVSSWSVGGNFLFVTSSGVISAVM